MNVFVSWSGSKSRAVALALREWLPSVIQAVKPWMSAEDIEAGARWNAEISKQLESTTFGIICLTKANQSKPWIMFEAGALAKTLQGTFVVPYLIDLEPAEVESGPLSQLQSKRANKGETWQLLVTLNRALASPLSEDQLRRIYDKFWGDLETVLNDLPSEDSPKQADRSPSDVLDEVLLLVRGIAQRQQIERLSTAVPPPNQITASPYRDIGDVIWDLTTQFWEDVKLHGIMMALEPELRADALRRYMEVSQPNLPSARNIHDPVLDALLLAFDYKYGGNEQKKPSASGFKSLREIIEGDEAPQADASEQGNLQAK